MKASKFLFNLSTVICFIYGALYIFSLVFIPIGVYCFIAAKRFQTKAEHINDTMFVSNQTIRNYVIFASIACFPLGLISIIPYLLTASNNVKISDAEEQVEQSNVNIQDVSESDESGNFETKTEEVEAYEEETEEEKIAKFNKLKNFHEKGIITDDELEMARQQLFGKEDK